jgi:polysaccharide deacetylase family protein (PEP-CTERM system associated)
MSMNHHFTVDVEESFQVSAMEPYVSRDSWNSYVPRVEQSTRTILDLLAHFGSTGTFFTLGWIAERHPELVREMISRGHEVASHGYGHERVTELTPAAFRESVRSSKAILEDITGVAVLGYRAPSFSIVRGGEWALDILLEEGYQYDSSLYPVARQGYGYADGGRDPYVLERPAGRLEEFPPMTRQLGRFILPAGGGAYFRHLPYWLVTSSLEEAERRGVPGTFYLHPWEVDTEQPRIATSFKTQLRHYGGISRTVPRLKRLLARFHFQSIVESLAVGAR